MRGEENCALSRLHKQHAQAANLKNKRRGLVEAAAKVC